MKGALRLLAAGALALAGAGVSGPGAFAQTATGTAPDTSAIDASTTHIALLDPAASGGTSAAAPDAWTATLGGGYAARVEGPSGGFALAALAHQFGSSYLRASLTRYRSTLSQSDVALPSTYTVGTLGGGGNYHNWVVDGWASYGWQTYGQVDSNGYLHTSTGAHGSPYYAFGADLGRVIGFAPGWYATPTLAVTYAHDRLLRPSPDLADEADFQTSETAWTGSAALRLDKVLGPGNSQMIGMGFSWHHTTDGLSELDYRGGLSSAAMKNLSVIHLPDSWVELGPNASLRIGRHVWLDTSLSRTFGVREGDTTNIAAGLRIGF